MSDLIDVARTDPKTFIQKVLDAADLSTDDLCSSWTRTKTATVDDVAVTWNIVHSEGGSEGEGEYVERVIHFCVGGEPEIFLRTTGFYESYNGTEWSGEWQVVYPREVLVTQYFETP